MASQAELDDPLQNLRVAIASGVTPILTTSADYPSAANTTENFASATHLTFNIGPSHKTFALTTPTRFAPNSTPIDLRTIFFAWQNRDLSSLDYLTALSNINEELPAQAGGELQNLNLVERSGLIDWLKGASTDNDHVRPLEGVGVSVDAEKSAGIASGKVGGVALDKGEEGGKAVDERLMIIYDGERKMGDHNTVLKGTKPVVSCRIDVYPYISRCIVPKLMTAGMQRTFNNTA
jgi:parafibromin